MKKKLTRSGTSVALVLDRGLLDAAGMDDDEVVEVSTDGRVIVIAPASEAKRQEKLEEGVKAMHARYAGAFKRLAK